MRHSFRTIPSPDCTRRSNGNPARTPWIRTQINKNPGRRRGFTVLPTYAPVGTMIRKEIKSRANRSENDRFQLCCITRVVAKFQSRFRRMLCQSISFTPESFHEGLIDLASSVSFSWNCTFRNSDRHRICSERSPSSCQRCQCTCPVVYSLLRWPRC